MIGKMLDSREVTEHRLERLAQRIPDNTVGAAVRLFGAVVESHGKAAFAARALDALAEIAERSDEASLIDAAGASSNVSTLLQVLERPEAWATVATMDPLTLPRIRGLRAQDWILQTEGGTLSGAQIGSALGITRQAVDKRRKQGTLIGLDLGRRGFAYPAWQISATGTLPGLTAVLAELADETPWGRAAFLLTSNVWLDGATPLAVLRRGEIEPVVNAARWFGDQTAV